MNKQLDNFDDLSEAILAKCDSLSKQLRKIGRFALENPTTIALDTIAAISKNAQVQPSALIRFAKAFDFDGFSEMQRVFQAHIAERSESYNERVQRELALGEQAPPKTPAALLAQLCSANVVSIEHLHSGTDAKQLEKAVSILHRADHVYIIGQRRSFPIATYLTYTLNRVGSKPHLMDGMGGLLQEQAAVMTKNDALIVISFHPYSSETKNVLEVANNCRVPSIAITDTKFSPVANCSDALFVVHDAELHSVRSLAASFCLAQTLATSLAFIEATGKGRKKQKRASRKPQQRSRRT